MRSPFLIPLIALAGLRAAPQEESGETKHLGGCVLLEPALAAPPDPYFVGEVERTEDYPPFTKKLVVCGITLLARDEVENDFLKGVAEGITEMFAADGESIEEPLQRDLLIHLHRHRTAIPFFVGEDFGLQEGDEEAWDRTVRENSICDIIMQGVPLQAMEVVEHVLHHVTDVGLHFTFPKAWALSEDSELHAAMQEAIEEGYYDIRQYEDIAREDPEIHRRVLLQEFAYWIITCAWDLQEPYGPEESEWKRIRTADQLEAALPRSFELVTSTIPRVMAPPSAELLDALDG